jgi:hypothetical protein
VGAGATEAMRREAGPPKLFKIIPNYSKQNQAKQFGFAWFYSSES